MTILANLQAGRQGEEMISPLASATSLPPLPQLPVGLSWLTVDQAAEREDKTPRRVRQLCEGEWGERGWAFLAHPEGGGKPQWHIRPDRIKAGAAVENAAAVAPGAEKLKDDPKATAGLKMQIFNEWKAECVAAIRFHGPNAERLTKEQVTQRFVAKMRERGIKISARTLRGWEKNTSRMGTAAFLDRRCKNGGGNAAPSDDPFLAFVRSKYMTREGLSARYCHTLASHKAQEEGWRVWSVRAVQEFVMSIPEPERVYAREGEKAYVDKCEQYFDRDWEPVRSNEQWGSDHHTLDLWVRIGEKVNTETGVVTYRNVRPNITVWIDNGSRKLLAWDLYAGDPCTDNIILSFRRSVKKYGVPQKVYVDNGKDYDSYALHGRTKRERLRGKGINGRFVFGTFAAMKVEAHNVQKYHGQSKLIERFFGTMEGQFCRLFPESYCGHSPAHKPDGLQERLAAGKAPTLDEVKTAFAEWAENFYNVNPHTGQGMNGKIPNVVYAEKLDVIQTADDRILDLLSLKHSTPVKVTQNGVRCNGFQYGKSVDALRNLMGQKVVVGFDPDNPHRVTIYTLDGDFVCAADSNERLPANADAAMMQEAMKRKRHARKADLKHRELRPYLHESTRNIMLDLAAERRAAEQKRLQDNPPPPPTIRPIRSPFEKQLPEIQRAIEAKPLKRAAGAEGLDLLSLANAVLELPTRRPARQGFSLLTALNDAPTDGSQQGGSR